MCISCGCGMPNDKHNNPDLITMDDLQRAAKAAANESRALHPPDDDLSWWDRLHLAPNAAECAPTLTEGLRVWRIEAALSIKAALKAAPSQTSRRHLERILYVWLAWPGSGPPTITAIAREVGLSEGRVKQLLAVARRLYKRD